MNIEGVTAFVTGGGSGLGRATAVELAKNGAKVFIYDLNLEAAIEVASLIGGDAFSGDVANENDTVKALEECCETLGDPRILVNCAGIGPAARIVGREGPMPLETFEHVVRVNLFGTFNTMRLLSAKMAELEPLNDGARGVIINTASVAATDGQIGQAAYAASKGAIASLALPAARELAKYGIRVNTIAPGIFKTPLLEKLPAEIQESLASNIPYPSRLGDPSEFATAVIFCITNQYLNGEIIRLDGAIRMAAK